MKTLLFALGVTALVGCSSVRPVGPLAKYYSPPSATGAGQPIDPTPPPPVKPTPPSSFVSPGDVSAGNPYDAATRLTNELSADSKSPANGPITVEVSKVNAKMSR